MSTSQTTTDQINSALEKYRIFRPNNNNDCSLNWEEIRRRAKVLEKNPPRRYWD